MRKLFTVVCLLFSALLSQSQTPIGGIINTYSKVDSVNACLNTAYAVTPGSFAVGDKVLLIQMKGADVNLTNTASFGNINAYNNAGNYEFAIIASITGTAIKFENVLLRTYTNGAALQLVKVPEYADANVTTTLTSAEWNGSTGGILVLQADLLTLNANLDVSGKGFRGGNAGNFPSSCPTGTGTSLYYSDTLSGKGGEKGEGIALLTNAYLACRGKAANGGGGGNDHNAGAGGGGNGAAGGIGGENDEPVFSCPGSEGFAGISVDNTALSNKIFAGAGGGAGHGNNNNASDGGDGGGIVIIVANQINGNGYSIISNGLSVTDLAWGDGAGGGGAGGSVAINANTVSSLAINAKGGKGGDTGADQCTGPGGGGAGGVLKVNLGAVWPGVTTDLTGGTFGTNTTVTSDCFGDNNGAAAGGNGITVTGFSLSESVTAYNPDFANAGDDELVCAGNTITLNASGGVAYSWSPTTYLDNPLIANPNCTPGADITYIVTVTNGSGCTDTDNLTVTIAPAVVANAGDDVIVCGGAGAALSASGGVNYSWSPTAFLDNPLIANPVSSTPIDLIYTVTVTDANGCVGTDEVFVDISNADFLTTSDDASVCAGGSLELNVSGGTTYIWSPSTYLDNPFIANPICTPLDDITYYVTSFNLDGCEDIDTVIISVTTSDFVSAGDDIEICAGNSTTLNATGGLIYNWSPSTFLDDATIANPICTPLTDITYIVTATSGFGCIDADTISVNVLPSDFADAVATASVCAGTTVELSASGGVEYSWSPVTYLDDPFSANPICTPLTDITYTVTVTNAFGCLDEATVNVNAISPLPVIAGPDTVTCGIGQIKLFVSEGESYLWTPATYLDNAFVQEPTSNPATSITYIVFVTDINGCINSDTVDIIVNPNPDIIASNDITICRGDTVTLSASGGVEYVWFPEPLEPCADCETIIAAPTATTTYTVQGYDANGCFSIDEVVVTVDVCDAIYNQLVGEINIYPNPANNYIVVEMPEIVTSPKFILFNILGEQIPLKINTTNNTSTLNFDKLPTQQLVLQIVTDFGVIYKTITVQN